MEPATTLARVTHGGHTVELQEGDSVRLGRSGTSDVQIGVPSDGPEDLGVSRTDTVKTTV